MTITIPELSLVVLVGASGSGKSSFAGAHFRSTEVLGADRFRALVSDDDDDPSARGDAVEVLHLVARKRLERGRLTVIDATNVEREARAGLLRIARETNVPPVAIVLDLPAEVCAARNEARNDRRLGAHVVPRQRSELRASLPRLTKEGFHHVYVLRSAEEVDNADVVRVKLRSNKKDDHGPFDIIGDVHGCAEELRALLTKLGYQEGADGVRRHPEGRKAVFLGDLVDRGPDVPGALRIAMSMAQAGAALCLPGNHEAKLERKLAGKNVKLSHGLAQTVAQLEREPAAFIEALRTFLDSLVSHYVLDGGRLVVAHAGLAEHLQGRSSGRVRQFALYGETTGETDDLGMPVRVDWAKAYRGEAAVVYGHTPITEPRWVNGTLCIDTGCVFGGKLTALRWPERELVSEPAREVYYAPIRPLGSDERPSDLLDIEDVCGERVIETRFDRSVTLREENTSAALERMSRFAIDPRWLVYLPPTMSPPESAREPGFLEHPREAFAYYRERGVERVVCEEKHAGSRAVLVLCRHEEAARVRFGDAKLGALYTRTGRRFFDDPSLEHALLSRARDAARELFDALRSDWLVLDAVLMPGSARTRGPLRARYAQTGAAGIHALGAAIEVLERAASRGVEGAPAVLERQRTRLERVERYVDACSRYCGPVRTDEDYAIAPFHLLASEGAVHTDRDHRWHLSMLERMARADALFRATAHRVVELADPESERAATAWWRARIEAGSQGMVVKPFAWMAKDARGLLQPALKCRDREYLRLIYGPEYTEASMLAQLRKRAISGKRRLAIKEYTLGLEGLARFASGEPLWRVHECVFGVLALESEPIDPRL